MDRMDLEPITMMDDTPQFPADFDWGGDSSPHGVDEVDRLLANDASEPLAWPPKVTTPRGAARAVAVVTPDHDLLDDDILDEIAADRAGQHPALRVAKAAAGSNELVHREHIGQMQRLDRFLICSSPRHRIRKVR